MMKIKDIKDTIENEFDEHAKKKMLAKIAGIEGMSIEQIELEVQQEGARFVVYECCISFIYMTIKDPTSAYFIRKNESAVIRGIGWSFITILLGWWGLPWGPINTIRALITNFKGGKDVTQTVLVYLKQPQDNNKNSTFKKIVHRITLFLVLLLLGLFASVIIYFFVRAS